MTDDDRHAMVEELLSLESGLTDWDIAFLDEMYMMAFYTPPMAKLIEELYERHFSN